MTEVDNNVIELIERRVSEKVEQDVRSRLFRSYVFTGTAVAAVLGWVGYSLISEAKQEAKNKIEMAILDNNKKIEDFKDKVIADYSSYFNSKKQEMDMLTKTISVGLEKSQWISQQVVEKLAKIDSAADDVQPQLAELKEKSQQVQQELEEISVKSRNLVADVATFQQLPMRVTQLAGDVQKIALDVSKLAGTGEAENAKSDILHSAVQTATNVQSTTAKIEADQSKPIVFLQYNSAIPAETANLIADTLKNENIIVPGIDNTPMGNTRFRELRYFNAVDAGTAQKVAATVLDALIAANLPVGKVNVRDYTFWKGTKPKPGTLELWLAEPTVAGP